MPRISPESFTKLVAIAAVAIGIPLHLWIDPVVGPLLRLVAATGFAAAFACGRRWPAMTLAVAIGAGPLVPALLTAAVHVPALNSFYMVWLAALCGVLLPASPLDRWELPATWRLPLGV